MKAGIVTFHYACNYGAVLQCLALYRAVRQLGVDVDIIRYAPRKYYELLSPWRGWGVRRGQLWRNIPRKWVAARHGAGMRRAFDSFCRQHFTFSPACTLPEEIAGVVSGYDALITGSDQVWNFRQDDVFFLEWGAPYDGKRIAYAPCCGLLEQPQERAEQIGEWLSRFDRLSVRNDFSRGLIEPLVTQPVPVVADPTLLTDLGDTARKVALPCSRYILTYTLGQPLAGGHEGALRLIREKVGDLPVVAVIPSADRPHRAPWADIKISEAGPAEWLYLVANASFVYTDSFHGGIFALKNARPFVLYHAEQGRSPRMLDFTRRYRLEGLLAHDLASLEGSLNAEGFGNYDEPLEQIALHAEASRAYLRDALLPEA